MWVWPPDDSVMIFRKCSILQEGFWNDMQKH